MFLNLSSNSFRIYKCILKNTAVLLQDNLHDDRNYLYLQWYSQALDIIESKIFKPIIFKAKRKEPTNVCKISFLKKSEELINVPHIFLDLSVKSCLPTVIKFDDPAVVYLLTIPTWSKYLISIN